MTTATNKLIDTKLRALVGKRPGDTPSDTPSDTPRAAKKHADGGGLFLLHTPSGSLLWRLKYRVGGAEQLLALGAYPETTLAQARAKRDAARAILADGGDPRPAASAPVDTPADTPSDTPSGKPATFRRFALEVLDALPTGTDKTDKTYRKWKLHLGYAIAQFGDLPIGDLHADEVMNWLDDTFAKCDRPRLDTLRSVKQKIDKVLRRAAIGRHCAGPFGEILRGALPTPVVKSHPAITDDPDAFGKLLVAIDRHRGSPAIRAALQFQALTFQRPGMVYAMTWDQVDFVNAVWAIPAEGMKGPDGKAQDHLVPLSAQALAVLNAMKPISGWRLDTNGHPIGLVFPGRYEDQPMSANSLNIALDRLGFKGVHSPHGFRASATTMLLERLGFSKMIIDVATAHVVKDPNGTAYNRAKWIDQRRDLFAAWGDYCDTLRAGTTNVRAFKAAA